jgi:hypothetical protein
LPARKKVPPVTSSASPSHRGCNRRNTNKCSQSARRCKQIPGLLFLRATSLREGGLARAGEPSRLGRVIAWSGVLAPASRSWPFRSSFAS